MSGQKDFIRVDFVLSVIPCNSHCMTVGFIQTWTLKSCERMHYPVFHIPVLEQQCHVLHNWIYNITHRVKGLNSSGVVSLLCSITSLYKACESFI